MNREAVYAALYTRLASLTTGASPLFKLVTRRVSTWEECSIDDQPALLMRQYREKPERVTGKPTKWVFDVRLLLYVHTSAQLDKTVIPGQMLNPLLDAIDAALPVDDTYTNTCTLGGLVQSCAIDGDSIEISLGNLGDEAVAVVPIRIVLGTNTPTVPA